MELPEVGTVFQSKYHLDEILGAGGFATVYRATDNTAGRIVAIKILTPDAGGYSQATISRFEREVQVVAQLRDPHTVTMFDFGKSPEGLLFVVFEFVPGDDLSKVIERHGRLEPAVVTHILIQVLQSLREAHAHGLLHRDIKPANIRVFEYMGDPYRVKVLDFGIARAMAPGQLAQITAKGELVGTPRYMSPEQLFGGDLAAATDIYSLGIVAFEMLMGSDAMHGTRLNDQLARLQTGHLFSVPELERIGPGLSQILDRMCAREPSARFRTADQALEALQAIERTASQPIAPPPAGAGQSGEFLPPRTGPQQAPLTPVYRLQPIRVDSGEVERRVPVPGAYTTHPTGQTSATPPRAPLPRLVAVLIVLVLSIVIVGAFVVHQMTTPDEPVVARVETRRAVPIVRPPTGVVQPIEAPPTDAPDASAHASKEVLAAPGCGTSAPFVGKGRLKLVRALDQRDYPAYVPTKYDPSRPHPLIVMLHENAEAPAYFIEYSGLAELAEEHGFILVAPYDARTPTQTWADSSDIGLVKSAIQDASERLCVDQQRIFAVSHGSGGKMIERLPCELPEVAAIAAASYRIESADPERCTPERPIPYLQLSPLKDGYNPVKGGVGCSGVGKLSLEAHEKVWRQNNLCAEKPRSVSREAGGVCTTWDCEAELVTCHLDGGRGWKGSGRRTFDIYNCDGTPPDFDSAKKIWEFFSRVAPRDDALP